MCFNSFISTHSHICNTYMVLLVCKLISTSINQTISENDVSYPYEQFLWAKTNFLYCYSSRSLENWLNFPQYWNHLSDYSVGYAAVSQIRQICIHQWTSHQHNTFPLRYSIWIQHAKCRNFKVDTISNVLILHISQKN